jgi:anti-sigma regulatory factor (Ser/Thr protein kinase)
MIIEVKNYQSMHAAISDLCNFLKAQEVSEDGVFHSKLVASELLGNVLRHSGGSATIHGVVKNEFVELTVVSTVKYTPPQKSVLADVYAENGRGLFLIDAVSVERWITESGDITVKIKR